ncbi:hypothetical protein ABT160_09170 [Streptomyces sp. NPDC001941]|uniref:hypothetical protein n=1 Tax=Streptomyces sp. NPDC001941 TaxID=3154659 RepID=UPI003331AFBA
MHDIRLVLRELRTLHSNGKAIVNLLGQEFPVVERIAETEVQEAHGRLVGYTHQESDLECAASQYRRAADLYLAAAGGGVFGSFTINAFSAPKIAQTRKYALAFALVSADCYLRCRDADLRKRAGEACGFAKEAFEEYAKAEIFSAQYEENSGAVARGGHARRGEDRTRDQLAEERSDLLSKIESFRIP